MKRIVCILALAMPVAAFAEPATVGIPAEDGFELKATLWQDDPGDPGILLLHQCNADRSMYEGLGQKLADAGFRALALDFRGFGDSIGEGFDLAQHGEREDEVRAGEKRPQDVEAAYQFLSEQGDGRVVAAMGASCGGGAIIGLAAAHPEIRLLTFLSSRLDAYAERDALRLPGPNMLFVYSEGDMRARRPAATINYRTRTTTLKILEGDAHGYPLFAEDPELEGFIVEWFSAGLAALETR